MLTLLKKALHIDVTYITSKVDPEYGMIVFQAFCNDLNIIHLNVVM